MKIACHCKNVDVVPCCIKIAGLPRVAGRAFKTRKKAQIIKHCDRQRLNNRRAATYVIAVRVGQGECA
jgi:hypothetical protein